MSPSAHFIECGGHGHCDHDTGECHCECAQVGALPCYFSPDCSLQYCPVVNGKTCNAQGTCNQLTGICTCKTGYGGNNCGTRFCGPGRTTEAVRSPGSIATLGHGCNNRGKCTDAGICYCNEGYWGQYCEQGEGPTVLNTMDIPETF